MRGEPRLPFTYKDRGSMATIGRHRTARVLRMSPTTVVAVLKKAPALQAVNPAVVQPPCSRESDVSVPSGCEAEMGVCEVLWCSWEMTLWAGVG